MEFANSLLLSFSCPEIEIGIFDLVDVVRHTGSLAVMVMGVLVVLKTKVTEFAAGGVGNITVSFTLRFTIYAATHTGDSLGSLLNEPMKGLHY